MPRGIPNAKGKKAPKASQKKGRGLARGTPASAIAPTYKLVMPKQLAKPMGPAETVQKMRALIDSGKIPQEMLDQFGIRRRVGRAVGIEDINKILALYQQYKWLFDLAMPFISKFLKPDAKPAPIVDEEDEDKTEPNPDIDPDEGEEEGEGRVVKGGTSKLFWITRKKRPFEEGGGRDLLSDDYKDKVAARKEKLTAGDRACLDVTPKDQRGHEFIPADPENDRMVVSHKPVGLAELQTQEDTKFPGRADFTPVAFMPWKGVDVGTQGEISIDTTVDGVLIKGPRLLVHVWGK